MPIFSHPYFLVVVIALGGVIVPTLMKSSGAPASLMLIVLSIGPFVTGFITLPGSFPPYSKELLFWASVAVGLNSYAYNTLVTLPNIPMSKALPMVSVLFVVFMTMKGWVFDREPIYDWEQIIGVSAAIISIILLGKKLIHS